MTIDIDSLRAEVLKRHNVALGKDDPILLTVTLNELVLASMLDLIRETSEDLERRGAARMAQEVGAVKSAAERLIGGAASVISAEVKRAGESAERSIVAALESRLSAAQKAAASAQLSSRATFFAALIASGGAMLTVGVALGALFKG